VQRLIASYHDDARVQTLVLGLLRDISVLVDDNKRAGSTSKGNTKPAGFGHFVLQTIVNWLPKLGREVQERVRQMLLGNGKLPQADAWTPNTAITELEHLQSTTEGTLFLKELTGGQNDAMPDCFNEVEERAWRAFREEFKNIWTRSVQRRQRSVSRSREKSREGRRGISPPPRLVRDSRRRSISPPPGLEVDA